jgi:hypothetical protein
MTWSTTSGRGVRKSEEAISGLKKISGARKRSYPTSTLYACGYHERVSTLLLSSAPPGAHLARPRVQSLVKTKELCRVLIVLAKLLDHVSTHITIVLLDLLGHAQRILGRDARLASLAKELLHEGRDVTSGDGDVADGGADDVALGLLEVTR